MLALLPAAATIIGLIVLGQVPTIGDLIGIALVIGGVALHHEPETQPRTQETTPWKASEGDRT
jgi:inner membrane transporter RhtA